MQNELKPCPCGNVVELKYKNSISESLLPYIYKTFDGSMPTYYIECDKCGRCMMVRLRVTDIKYRDKCKRELIKAWNRRYGDEMDKR